MFYISVVCGLIGAILFALYQKTGYEPGTGLPVSGNTFGMLLAALTVIMLVISVLGFIQRRRNIALLPVERSLKDVSSSRALLRVVSGFMLIACGALYILEVTQKISVVTMIIGILAVLSGFGVIAVASGLRRGHVKDEHALYAIIPIFWICLVLIVFFRQHSANPFLRSYVYPLFAMAFAMLAVCSYAGLFVRRPYTARAIYTSALAIYFLITAFGGSFLATILSGGTFKYALPLRLMLGGLALFLYILAAIGQLSDTTEGVTGGRRAAS